MQEDYKEQKAILQPLWDEKNTSLTEVNLQANQYTIHQTISTCRFHCEKLFLCLYLSKKSLRTKQRQAKGKQPSKKTPKCTNDPYNNTASSLQKLEARKQLRTLVARQTPLLSRKRLRRKNRTIRIRTATNPNNKKSRTNH